jgi:hypothetical protein
MENGMPKIKINQKLNKRNINISSDNNNSYFKNYENRRNKRNIRKIPDRKYYFNNPKLYTNSYYIESSNKNNTRKDSFSSFNIETDNNALYHIIHSLKNTLQDAERIKQQYLGQNKNYNINKSFIPKKKYDSLMNMNIAPYNNKYEDDSINYDDSYNYENDIISGNNDLDEDVDEESNNEIINKNIIDNLNMKRSLLMKSNIRMRKENRILEREINNYQKQFLNHKNLYNIYNNIFPKNFHFFKTNLLSSINNNTNILDQIFKSQQINQNIINKIKKIYSRNENIFKKVESINREKAEIQILNEENEKKLNDLKEENELYKDEMQKIKLELTEMKYKSNNLNVLKSPYIKKYKIPRNL